MSTPLLPLVDAHAYTTLADATSDIELVWSNALAYNPAGSAVHTAALKHRQWFRGEVKVVTDAYVRVISAC